MVQMKENPRLGSILMVKLWAIGGVTLEADLCLFDMPEDDLAVILD